MILAARIWPGNFPVARVWELPFDKIALFWHQIAFVNLYNAYRVLSENYMEYIGILQESNLCNTLLT